MGCLTGNYYPEQVSVPLDAVRYAPAVPPVRPIPEILPAGLQVGHLSWLHLLVTTAGSHPIVRVYVDWSPTGWSLSEFSKSATPVLEIDGAGVHALQEPIDVLGEYAMIRIEGVGGNAPDTTVAVVVGGS